MKRIHQIALHGMKGRKKDTAVLITVIVMSFLFLTVGTILLSSLTESQYRQRMSLYGSWKLSDNHSNPAVTEVLSRQSWITGSHQVEILGADRRCGNVSVWDDSFARMGGLKLTEGRAPEAPGEIVLERGQLSLFDEPVGLGSEVDIRLSYEGTPSRELTFPNLPQTLEIYSYTVDAQPFYNAFAQDVTAKMIEDAMACYVHNREAIFAEYQNLGIPLPELPMELPDSIEQMTHEQIGQFLDALMTEPIFLYSMVGSSIRPIQIRNLSSVHYPAGQVGQIHWTMDTTYTLRTAAAHIPNEMCMQYGAVTKQDLTLSRTCTVVGILETTADRWDVTGITVPNCYLSGATQQELQATVEELSQRNRPEQFCGSSDTILTQESYSFYETGDSMADTYENLRMLSGNIMDEVPEEVLYGSGAPIPDIALTPQQMEQEAAPVLSDLGISPENIGEMENTYPLVYVISFAPELEEDARTSAYYVVPKIQVFLKDGTRVRLPASFGHLLYPDGDGWQTQTVDFDTMQYTDFAPEGYRSLGYFRGSLEDAYAYNSQLIGINRYAYPADRNLAGTMGGTLVSVIVIITVCAVFQIFFTQLRRRTRKLTLLRSIGATNGQIFALLGFEGLYITLAGLVLGDGLGLLTACLVVSRLSDTVFYVDWRLFLTGQLWGLLAVVSGMILPSIQAIRAPLVGRMTGKRRRHVKIRPMKRQSFPRLCTRDLRANPGRTLGMAALCIFLVTMQLVCIFLGNTSFSAYRETILNSDRPDFALTMNHAGSQRKVEPMTASLREIDGLERCDFYRRGRNLFLWYEGMNESPVVKAVQETDSRFFTATQSIPAQKTEPGLLTEFYNVEPDTELFDRIRAAVTEGSIDEAAYAEGKEVILILPMYSEEEATHEPKGDTMAEALRSAGRMTFSLDPKLKKLWNRDTTLSPGSAVTLGTDSYLLRENGSCFRQTLLDARVGGIIRCFPGRGIWPFAGDVQSHVVIGSRKAMGTLYSDGFFTYDFEQMNAINTRSAYFMPTQYGTGVWCLYAKDGAAVESTLSPLSRFARDEHLTLHNFMDSKRTVYEKALSSAILAATMALAATLIVWLILYNTLNAAQEQGRSRTGILQALGVTRSQLYWAQAVQALGYWGITVALSNLILIATVLISGTARCLGLGFSLFTTMQMVLQNGFQGYPWMLHWFLCLLELPVLLAVHLHAAAIPMKYSPIDNIRS